MTPRVLPPLFLALFLLVSTSLAAAPPEQYRIGLGDLIEVQVWKEPELSRQVKVRLDGRISLPLAGDIPAAGRTPAELAATVTDTLKTFISDPAVSVIVIDAASRRYYVIGQVNKPGEFAIDYPVTFLQAIARAGGFQEWAKRDRIVVVRRSEGKETLIPFDYDAVSRGSKLEQNQVVLPGDTIIVP